MNLVRTRQHKKIYTILKLKTNLGSKTKMVLRETTT